MFGVHFNSDTAKKHLIIQRITHSGKITSGKPNTQKETLIRYFVLNAADPKSGLKFYTYFISTAVKDNLKLCITVNNLSFIGTQMYVLKS